MKAVIAIAATLMLAGCASNGLSSRPANCAKPGSDQELALNLADNMANEGRLYASLANLEGLPDNLVQVRLRKARVLRLMGRSEAGPLYKACSAPVWPLKGNMAWASWPPPKMITPPLPLTLSVR